VGSRADRALDVLAEHHPPVAMVALRLRHRDVDDDSVAMTDGAEVLYGRGFDRHGAREKAAIALHEALHAALRHPQRVAAIAAR